MSRVHFDPSPDTVHTIEHNDYDKFWKRGEVPFAQTHAKMQRREPLTDEEKEELRAYRDEVKARTTGKRKAPEGPRQRNLRTMQKIRELLASNLDEASRQRLLDVKEKVIKSIRAHKDKVATAGFAILPAQGSRDQPEEA